MSSYSATMIIKDMNGNPTSAGGSFGNINLDGRLSMQSAIDAAKEVFKNECTVSKLDYMGFAIEKTNRFVNYKKPLMIDTNLKANEVGYLL